MNKAMNVVVYEVFLLIILNERNAIPEEEKKQIFGLFTCLGASIGKVVIIPGGKDKKFEIVIAFARNVSKILLGLKQYATSDMEEEAQRRTDEFMVSIGIA